jgi:hypothetical protein
MQSDYCQTAVIISQLGNVLINMSAGIIFGYRVSALWGGNKAVKLVVGLMYIFMVTSWVFLLYSDPATLLTLQNPGGRGLAISRHQWATGVCCV